MRPVGVVATALLLACSDPHPDATDRHLPTPAERAAAPRSSAERMFAPPADAATVHVRSQLTARWSHVTADPTCFFFSGPDGRDDQLTGPAVIDRDGGAVSISIGAAVFIGTFVDNELRASRQSRHDFAGTWTVTETLLGHYRDGVMSAAYHYIECGPGGPCPDHCTIDGTLAFQR